MPGTGEHEYRICVVCNSLACINGFDPETWENLCGVKEHYMATETEQGWVCSYECYCVTLEWNDPETVKTEKELESRASGTFELESQLRCPR